MIYQPRNPRPSTSAVDAKLDNIFSITAQTNTSIIAYQLTIIDFDNNLIYDGEKVIMDVYAYNGDDVNINVPANSFINGKNYKWNLRMFQIEPDILVTYGLVQVSNSGTSFNIQTNINIRIGMNLLIGEESRIIENYDVDSGLVVVNSPFTNTPESGDKYYVYSDFIDTTSEYVFYSRETASVIISNSPDILTVKYHEFNGIYSQSNGIPIRYHIFNLYSLDNFGDRVLIDTTGQVYSANLRYYYDGFRTNQQYYIELIVENEMGIVVQSLLYDFTVSYDIIEYLQQPTAQFLPNKNANMISWVAPVEFDGYVYRTGDEEIQTPNILYQTPYDGVNSLYTNGVFAQWHNDEGIYVVPDNAQISMQFSPDDDFYYGINNFYNKLQILVEGSSNDKYEKGYFTVYINYDYIGVMSPDFLSDGSLNSLKIVGENSNKYQLQLSEDINIDKVKYITSIANGWIAEIVGYDSSSKIAILSNELPEEPVDGEDVFINIYSETLIYTGTVDKFCVSSSSSPKANEDYIWDDDGIWNDSYFWTEGGTPVERVCNNWWKINVTKDSIKVERVVI